MHRPAFLYKYRKDEYYSLDALFSCKAIFGGRKAFNDTFDARVALVAPTIEELKRIDSSNLRSLHPLARGTPTLVDYQGITRKGKKYLQNFYKSTEALIDSYRFYCLSANPISTPMWYHYCADHTGFCIEFKSEFIGGDKVTYKDELPEIRLAEFLLDYRHQFGIDIWEALRTKHTDWAHEKEYRIQTGNGMAPRLVFINENTDSVHYEPVWVEAIIFGKDMPDERRRDIVAKYQFPVKFKQVVVGRGALEIIDFL
ncbi:DUF2971 domain-containing protein [Duganella sp. FT27W]|uniref:DUF2971 domain-containing protein n=1 Tax=Duganella sp. FT27W TaxID=2654636 RepID=UPI00128BCF38|nr:DUF2971 domain-containing protein [Duganella sp. FT27W]MPQ57389.1 DUF2971 domain-containing protein [Duganella sp. FT27W]